VETVKNEVSLLNITLSGSSQNLVASNHCEPLYEVVGCCSL